MRYDDDLRCEPDDLAKNKGINMIFSHNTNYPVESPVRQFIVAHFSGTAVLMNYRITE